MNILSFFNITKMTNKFADFKNYLKLLSSEERLREINLMNSIDLIAIVKKLQKDFAY